MLTPKLLSIKSGELAVKSSIGHESKSRKIKRRQFANSSARPVFKVSKMF